VIKTKSLYKSENIDLEKIVKNENNIAEMTDKYVVKYVKPEYQENVRANISDWAKKSLRGDVGPKVTEDDVLAARDKFESDYYKYHLSKNPIDLLNAYVLYSASDASTRYKDADKKVDAYESLLSNELNLTKFVEMQDYLMQAVQLGNTAHIKDYFKDYYIGENNQLSMNSDEAIDYMVRSLLLDDNTKSAKMFVEKLGLGDRVMNIEKGVIDEIKPMKEVDSMVKTIKAATYMDQVFTEEFENLKDKVDTTGDIDASIESTKEAILKRMHKKGNSKFVKAYVATLDDMAKCVKENPAMQPSLLLDAVNLTVIKEIKSALKDEVSAKQENITSIISLYKFLSALRLPEYSDGYKLQQQLMVEFNDFLKYNNEKISAVLEGNTLFRTEE
jgi:hypothetical protein